MANDFNDSIDKIISMYKATNEELRVRSRLLDSARKERDELEKELNETKASVDALTKDRDFVMDRNRELHAAKLELEKQLEITTKERDDALMERDEERRINKSRQGVIDALREDALRERLKQTEIERDKERATVARFRSHLDSIVAGTPIHPDIEPEKEPKAKPIYKCVLHSVIACPTCKRAHDAAERFWIELKQNKGECRGTDR